MNLDIGDAFSSFNTSDLELLAVVKRGGFVCVKEVRSVETRIEGLVNGVLVATGVVFIGFEGSTVLEVDLDFLREGSLPIFNIKILRLFNQNDEQIQKVYSKQKDANE